MPHSARARAQLAFACAVALLAVTAATALAAGNPVHVDPASPVAKEYALPLGTARGAAPESGQSGKLFGSGITTSSSVAPSQTDEESRSVGTATSSTAGTATSSTAGTASSSAAGAVTPSKTDTVSSSTAASSVTPSTARTPPGPARPPAKAQAAPAAYRVLRPGSGSGWLWMVLAAAVVVTLGGVGGIALRRRR